MSALPTLIKLTTPLPPDVLRFYSMNGTEEMGRPFEYRLVALSERRDLDPKQLLGKPAGIALELSDRSKRHFHGIVTRMGLSGAQGRLFAYELTLNPWLWLLSRRSDTRIFQAKSVPDILREVFSPLFTDFKLELGGSYPPREYCVQYRETDLDFVSRLMEQEGIYYFFRHTESQHLMVLADRSTVPVPVPGFAEFRYRPQELGAIEYEAITEWHFSEQIQPGRVSLKDYNFLEPQKDLLVDKTRDRGHAAASIEHYDPLVGDYPDNVAGERYAALRLEELHARYAGASGTGTMSAMATGTRFSLIEHPRKDQNREYIVLSTRFELRHPGYESGIDDVASYLCHFTALDSREVFRPQRLTPRPTVPGPLTAMVVGPAGDEIFTDGHGRIKVQFHWDRLGRRNEDSSCWIRVAQPAAGGGFGGILLPRIGHEVVVEFLGGDPDRPLVTGSVYNGKNLTPYPLPDQATVSSLKSRSSAGGTASNFNELRFDDRSGQEYVFMQAEKDHLQLVKADRITQIGTDDMLTIGRDRREAIGGFTHLDVGADSHENIGGASHTTVGGDALVEVGGVHGLSVRSDAMLDVGMSLSHNVGTDMDLKAGMNAALDAGMNLHLKGGMNVVIEAGTLLTLKVGGNSVVISSAGVSITGTMVMINSGGPSGAGQGSNPQAPSKPKPVEKPTALKDPLGSR